MSTETSTRMRNEQMITILDHLARIERLACVEAVSLATTEGQQAALYGCGIEILAHAKKMAAQIERWKRMAMAHAAYEDALLFAVGADEQEAARAELRAAHADLKAHGDLPNDRREGYVLMTELNFCPDCGDVLDGSCECPPCEFDEGTRTVEQAWVDGIYRQSIDLLGQLQSLDRVLLADLDDFYPGLYRASRAAKRMRKVVQDIRQVVTYTRLVNRS